MMSEVCLNSSDRFVAVSTDDQQVQYNIETLLSDFASMIVSLRSVVATGGGRWSPEISKARDVVAIVDVSSLHDAEQEIERIGGFARRAKLIILARCAVSMLEPLKNSVAAIVPIEKIEAVLPSVAQLTVSGFTVFQNSESGAALADMADDDPDLERLKSLSQTEARVLLSLTEGRSNKQIANEIHISDNTVRVHMRTIFLKLGVQNRTQAALLATRFKYSGVLDEKAESFHAKRQSRQAGCQTPIAME